MDTGVFADNRYFDVEVEYAKADPEDMLISDPRHQSRSGTARLDLLPTIWFRNTWSWGTDAGTPARRARGEQYGVHRAHGEHLRQPVAPLRRIAGADFH